jgi:ATP/maltotriose-dependent transcriptional regulator MalT
VDVLCVRASAALGAEDLAGSDAYAAEAMRWAEKGGDSWQIAQAAGVHAEAAESLDDLRDRVAGAIPQLEAEGNVFRVADLLASASYTCLCLGGDREAREFTARALPLTRALETPYVEMMLAGNTGLAALLTGELEEARRWFEQELTICRQLATLPFATEALNGLAAIAVEQGDLDRAARLHGAAWAHRYGQPEDPVTDRLERRYFVSARRRLGAAAWETAAAEGAAMSWYEAIAYGLGEA